MGTNIYCGRGYTIDCTDGKYVVISIAGNDSSIIEEIRLFSSATTICLNKEEESITLIGMDETLHAKSVSLDGSLGGDLFGGLTPAPETYTNCAGRVIDLSTSFLQLRDGLATCVAGCCGGTSYFRDNCNSIRI